jgi:phosphatidylglycerol:prolipoprotein diacylglycerol transferase
MAYGAFVALAIVVGLFASRRGPVDPVPADVRRRVRIGALVGAVLGAHLFELPADLLGWTAVPDHGGTPWLGRTVLGGILGGWLGVELMKWRAGFRGATGDRFAAPLAMSLAIGRLGCVVAGCCPGAPIDASSPWARLSPFHDPPRFPATLIEAYFHAFAAVVLLALSHRSVAPGRLFPGYVAALAAVRFGLEEVRANPPVALGLTYYQGLAALLFVLAAATWLRRAPDRGAPTGPEAAPSA